MKWEYCQRTYPYPNFIDIAELNHLGESGWELVSVLMIRYPSAEYCNYLLKRLLPEPVRRKAKRGKA